MRKIFLSTVMALMATWGACAHAQATEESASSSTGGVVGKVESGVSRGVHAAASGVERGVKAAARGVSIGVKAAASGVERGAKATAHAVEKVAGKVTGNSPSAPEQ